MKKIQGSFLFMKLLFRSIVWHIETPEKEIYLTFDDGPTPELTPWVLDELEKHNAHATFFCIGQNAEKYPEIISEIRKRHHAIGNHTYRHLNGWKTSLETYARDVERCSEIIPGTLFRPPHGRLRPSQFNHLKKFYRIVMWDVLSRDYDQDVSAERCLRNVIDTAREGSVALFHDNYKAEKSLKYILPRVLSHYSGLEYSFKSMDNQL